MALSKINTREQILVAVVAIVLILGSYTLFRFIPENKHIVSLQNQAEKTERKLQSARIPDEPDEGIDELLKQLDDQEQSLNLINEMADGVAQNLAPFDSQQVIIMVSQLARQSDVLVKTSETLKVAPIQATSQKKKKKKKSKNIINETNIILPATRNWIDRMSASTLFHRPMQRLILEGDYQSLRSFIHGLDDLGWQVTVVRFKIEKMPTAPMQGFAQRLQSELVLAL